MRNIVIHKHGHSWRNGLSITGQRQAEDTGRYLKSLLGLRETVEMISSPAPNAVQDAKLIASILGIEFEEENFLWTGIGGIMQGEADTSAASFRINLSDADMVILIAHQEFVQKLPIHIARMAFGLSGNFPSLSGRVVLNGDSIIINMDKGECSIYHPKVNHSGITQ